MNEQRAQIAQVIGEFGRLMGCVRTLQTTAAGHQAPWLDLDLTMAQLKVLMMVAGTGGVSGRAVAEQLRIGPSAVTPLVDKLVQHGYVRREEDVEDRRITWIRPTPKGSEVFERVIAARSEHMEKVLADLPPEDLERVRAAFATLRLAMERHLARTGGKAGEIGAPSAVAGVER